jgi:hypothetical protein
MWSQQVEQALAELINSGTDAVPREKHWYNWQVNVTTNEPYSPHLLYV